MPLWGSYLPRNLSPGAYFLSHSHILSSIHPLILGCKAALVALLRPGSPEVAPGRHSIQICSFRNSLPRDTRSSGCVQIDHRAFFLLFPGASSESMDLSLSAQPKCRPYLAGFAQGHSQGTHSHAVAEAGRAVFISILQMRNSNP